MKVKIKIKKMSISNSQKSQTSVTACTDETSIYCFPHKPVFNERELNARDIKLATNYFPFIVDDHFNIGKMAVTFTPEIPEDNGRYRRIVFSSIKNQVQEKFGNYIFNNTILFVSRYDTIMDGDGEVSFEAKGRDNEKYTIKLTWITPVESKSVEAMAMYNRFFKTLLSHMKYTRFGRSYFDPHAGNRIKNIELWPGFEPTIKICNSQILLNLNMGTKVIRSETAYDVLLKIKSQNKSNEDLVSKAQLTLTHCTVLTKYNNHKTYTISCVDFSLTPQSKFDTKMGSITYYDYYKQKYHVIIEDVNQPLLTVTDKKTKKSIKLIPELCFMTGLTDEMMADFQFMKEMHRYTLGKAQAKMKENISLLSGILANEGCKSEIKKWGINLVDKPVTLTGKQLDPGNMRVFRDEFCATDQDIDRKVQTQMYSKPTIQNWTIFYAKSSESLVMNNFINIFHQCMNTFKIQFPKPRMIPLQRGDYVSQIQMAINPNNLPQFVVCILQGQKGKGFQYNELKTLFNHTLGIPSQMILEGTIKRDKGIRSVINKVLMQICAKSGGIPWIMTKMPCTNVPTMIISFSVYKELVASCGSINNTFSQYYSTVDELSSSITITELLQKSVLKLLHKFKEIVRQYPENVIILRDGITPGLHAKQVEEAKAIKKCLKELEKVPNCTYILVNKKHNLKVVKVVSDKDKTYYENIPSGTLIDTTVIPGNFYEFYLVSQKAGQGISQSTQYKVIYDECDIKPNDLYLMIYKMCFLYYNWVGSIKTPAAIHYAKKLVTLVADKQCIKKKAMLPKEGLGSLYFL